MGGGEGGAGRLTPSHCLDRNCSALSSPVSLSSAFIVDGAGGEQVVKSAGWVGGGPLLF
jgi:hypothetical protein